MLTRTPIDMVVDRSTGQRLDAILNGKVNFVSTPPTTPSATGKKGDWSADSGYLYVCFADNQWSRVAITTW